MMDSRFQQALANVRRVAAMLGTRCFGCRYWVHEGARSSQRAWPVVGGRCDGCGRERAA